MAGNARFFLDRKSSANGIGTVRVMAIRDRDVVIVKLHTDRHGLMGAPEVERSAVDPVVSQMAAAGWQEITDPTNLAMLAAVEALSKAAS